MAQPQLQFYHSGGGNNCNPLNDLGGAISTCSISPASLNNLFNDLTPGQSRNGLTDYRCIYISNSGVSSARNAKLYIDYKKKGGSLIDVGIPTSVELQKLEVTGSQPPAEGAYMTLSVPGYSPSFTVYYSVNPTIWQGRFQTEMRGVDGLQDVIISEAGAIDFPTDIVFTISYVGQAQNKAISVINVVSTNMNSQTIAATEYQRGAPVNTIAASISSTTSPPPAVQFFHPTRGSPLYVGDLRPSDNFPLWIRRTTPANTVAKTLDNFRLNLDAVFP